MKKSAGILLYYTGNKEVKVLLVHPGGPFFRKKNKGYWTIPKGLVEDGETPEKTALREFEEETGIHLANDLIYLGDVKQKGGKVVSGWAVETHEIYDVSSMKSNIFEMEWPPKSGKKQAFSEIDKACWFTMEDAQEYINQAQQSFLERLREYLNYESF